MSSPTSILHRGGGEEFVSLGPYRIQTLILPHEEAAATAYRVRIEPYQQTSTSYHKVAEELYYVLAGSGTAILNGVAHALKTGDFLRLPPGTTHAFATAGEPLEMLDIHTPGSRPDHDVYFVGEAPPGFGGAWKEAILAIQITSSAFEDGERIPVQYTADGADVSPPLAWSEPPAGTQSFVLICEDPDAPRGIWTHWVLFNLPAETRTLEENIAADAELPDGARHGKNDFRKLGYGGPAPPPGKPHRYYFRLHALDTSLNVPAGISRTELLKAMRSHILGEAQLLGTYGR